MATSFDNAADDTLLTLRALVGLYMASSGDKAIELSIYEMATTGMRTSSNSCSPAGFGAQRCIEAGRSTFTAEQSTAGQMLALKKAAGIHRGRAWGCPMRSYHYY